MAANYEYVPVSASEAKRAWRDFQSRLGRTSRTPDLGSVAFIPALGGSFVVLTAAEKHTWFAALKDANWGLGSHQAESLLQSFKRYLTGS